MHSVALNFLQRFSELIGLTPHKITIYGQFEADFLLKKTAKDLGYHDGYKWKGVKKGDVYRILEKFNSNNIIGYEYDEFYNEISIIDAFNTQCKENTARTYDSILYQFHKLLPKIKDYLGFKHIMVDEIQDNSKIQWDITESMTSLCDASLFVLGDINQSIYQFRGAVPEYILNNQASFDILKLQKNYRSDANIVEAANRLIKHNTQTIELEMVAVKDKETDILIVKDFDSKKIAENLGNLNKTNGHAVLARNHFLLEKLSKLLDESGIKHEYIGKQTKLVHSENFRRFNAFFNLIVNPNDNFSFLLIKNILTLSTQEYGEIRMLAAEQGKSHYAVWAAKEKDTEWEKWFASSEKADMDTIIDWLKFVKFDFNIDKMLDFIYLWRLENYDKDVSDYLNWLNTYDIQDEIKKDSKGLLLSTIHGVKGLEFETVIIAGLNESILPSKQSIKKNDIEEETRLFYVGMTRARNQLILTSRTLEKDLFDVKNPISRFIGWSLDNK